MFMNFFATISFDDSSKVKERTLELIKLKLELLYDLEIEMLQDLIRFT